MGVIWLIKGKFIKYLRVCTRMQSPSSDSGDADILFLWTDPLRSSPLRCPSSPEMFRPGSTGTGEVQLSVLQWCPAGWA